MSSDMIDEEGELSDKYRAARKEQMDAFMFMITKSSQILRVSRLSVLLLYNSGNTSAEGPLTIVYSAASVECI